MRVGMLVTFGLGGTSTTSVNLIKGLTELGVEVWGIYNDMCIPQEWMFDPNTKIVNTKDAYPKCQMVEVKHASELNYLGLDIFHTQFSGSPACLRIMPGLESTQRTFTLIETNFHGELHTPADIRVFPSKALVDFYHIQIPHYVIPNPINPPLATYNLKHELGLDGKFVYGRVGRNTKDIYTNIALKAYQKIQTDNTAFIWLGPCDTLIKDVAELKLKNFVAINPTCNLEKISAIYNTMDVYCHNNALGETFGNTVAEAMAHGKPPITYKCSDFWPQAQKEILGELSQQLYITENIIENYAQLMLRLREDTGFYREMSTKVIKRASEYDYRIVSKRYLNLYETNKR